VKEEAEEDAKYEGLGYTVSTSLNHANKTTLLRQIRSNSKLRGVLAPNYTLVSGYTHFQLSAFAQNVLHLNQNRKRFYAAALIVY
jgi:hypothetical protein